MEVDLNTDKERAEFLEKMQKDFAFLFSSSVVSPQFREKVINLLKISYNQGAIDGVKKALTFIFPTALSSEKKSQSDGSP